jgi:hypothetical protein
MPTIARMLCTIGVVLGYFVTVGLATLGTYALYVEPRLLGANPSRTVVVNSIMPFLLEVVAAYGVVALAGALGYAIVVIVRARVSRLRRIVRHW